MTHTPDDDQDAERVENRTALLPEEEAVGSDDPHAQAQQILEESDERTESVEETGADSTQTSSPEQRGR
ncbi:hypothetical protein [Nocardioides massiliensis]|uniref:Multidrug transporter n=1 Tax=Nocardioides massiliensis TaxID=1325935 RepID=A0ABT9NT05_9ACTN|nr:hypothetical protein [Nocardioides massiliensis]MDP9823412.1 hypothetical protein [Nocardioides massiliensis]